MHPRLSVLNAARCDSLEEVDASGLDAIEQLKLENCKSLKIVRGLSGLHSLHDLDVGPNESLESIGVLSDLPALTSIFVDDCPKLKQLKLVDCNQLDVAWCTECVLSLEEIYIERCDAPSMMFFPLEEEASLKKLTIKDSGVSQKDADMFRLCHPEIEFVYTPNRDAIDEP